MSARRAVSAALALALVTGCARAPLAVELPEPPVPASWPVGDPYLAQAEAELPALPVEAVFRDTRLQRLIALALAESRDLRIAAATVEAARAQVRVVRAGQFPAVGVTAGADVTRADGATDQRYSVQGGVAGFELDFFGKFARATEAQRNRALATEAAARTVRVGLIADVAAAWAAHAADAELLAIAEATAANARESVRLTDARRAGGVAPRTDLAQAQQVLAAAELAIAQQRAALAQDVNLLRLLVGADIDPALLPASLPEVEAAVAEVPAGTSARVLLRRPDVIDAEYRLRAASADIASARAALFPSISLSGLAGLAANALGSLFSGGAFTATAGADIGVTLFDAGGRRATVAVTEAERDAALAEYEGTIQAAFREVADALARQGTLAASSTAAAANQTAAATAARLTEARYRNGIDSFLESLIAQRSLFAARQQAVGIALARIVNRITLYRVLGGDAGAPPPPA